MAFEEGIEIGDLDATVLPNLLHRIPAQRNGVTVFLTVQQIVDFALAALRDGVSSDLDTMSELAAAIGNNADFATMVFDAIEAGVVPTGMIAPYGNTTAPSGWIKANGASLSRTTYSQLFAIYGTTFGSVDGSTFNVPDLRGEFIRGWDDSRGVDSGRVFGSAQAQQVEAHTHNINGTSAGRSTGAANSLSSLYSGPLSGNTQVNSGTETRPRNVALQYIIKF